MSSSNARLRLDELKKRFNQLLFHEALSIELTRINKREVIVGIRSDLRHKNLHGFIHGGALASLIDAATGMSVFPHLKDSETAVTISLNIDYNTPAVIQKDLVARGKMVFRSKRLARAEAVITDSDHQIIAKGSSSLMIIAREREEAFGQ